MLSKLETLIAPYIRHAESSDTRQSIREDEKRDEQSNNNDETLKKEEQDLWTDQTVVSIESLKTFLTGFLRDQVELDTAYQNTNIYVKNNVQKEPVNTKTAYAINAYKTYVQSTYSNPEPAAQSIDKNTVDNDHIRRITRLIRTLDSLSQNGYKALSIPKEGTFLESIEAAAYTLSK